MSRVFYYLKYPLTVLLIGGVIAVGLYHYGPDELNPVPDLIRAVTIVPTVAGLGVGAVFKRRDQLRVKWLAGKRAVTRQLVVLVSSMIFGAILMSVLANLVFTNSRVFSVIDWGYTLGVLAFSIFLTILYMRVLMVNTKDDWS